MVQPTIGTEEQNAESLIEGWSTGTDTFARVYRALLSFDKHVHHSEIADVAECSEPSSRKHLQQLHEMGIARRRPHTQYYCRNEGYVDWWDANRIAEDVPIEYIMDRIETLEQRCEELENKHEANNPANVVSAQDTDDDLTVSERIEIRSEYEKADRRLRVCEFAVHIATNDGQIIS